jgi:hypothetical protein
LSTVPGLLVGAHPCRKPTRLRARDGSLDSRSPVGSRMRRNELLVGYARPSTEQQDLTAQRDGLHALGVVSRRVLARVRRYQRRVWVAVPEVVGIRRLRIDCSRHRSRPPWTIRRRRLMRPPHISRSTFPYPSRHAAASPVVSFASAAHRDHGLFDRDRVVVGRSDTMKERASAPRGYPSDHRICSQFRSTNEAPCERSVRRQAVCRYRSASAAVGGGADDRDRRSVGLGADQ